MCAISDLMSSCPAAAFTCSIEKSTTAMWLTEPGDQANFCRDVSMASDAEIKRSAPQISPPPSAGVPAPSHWSPTCAHNLLYSCTACCMDSRQWAAAEREASARSTAYANSCHSSSDCRAAVINRARALNARKARAISKRGFGVETCVPLPGQLACQLQRQMLSCER